MYATKNGKLIGFSLVFTVLVAGCIYLSKLTCSLTSLGNLPLLVSSTRYNTNASIRMRSGEGGFCLLLWSALRNWRVVILLIPIRLLVVLLRRRKLSSHLRPKAAHHGLFHHTGELHKSHHLRLEHGVHSHSHSISPLLTLFLVFVVSIGTSLIEG